jgi:hypothetical protein
VSISSGSFPVDGPGHLGAPPRRKDEISDLKEIRRDSLIVRGCGFFWLIQEQVRNLEFEIKDRDNESKVIAIHIALAS